MNGADNAFVRAVSRVPGTVQRKLLATIGVVALLLVAVGVLGLVALNASNGRVDALGVLPLRVATYGELEVEGKQLSSELEHRDTIASQCGATGSVCVALDAATLNDIDASIDQTLKAIAPLSDVRQLPFAPAPDQKTILSVIYSEYVHLSVVMPQL